MNDQEELKMILIGSVDWHGKICVDTYTLLKTDLYCPDCGKKTLWRQPWSEADYGGGDCHACSNCGSQFYGRRGYEKNEEMTNKLAELERALQRG